MREAALYEKLSGNRVRCHLCQRHCTIEDGKKGRCGMRINKGGRLIALSYGNLSAIESRPIEIKPFFHYYPGSRSLTISTWSCNFGCPWCQNYHLSGVAREGGYTWTPEMVLGTALDGGDEGICVSFNEPTLCFEFCLDLFPLARERGLYCCFVSNGYMTEEALDMLVDAGLDGMNVDIKGRQEAYERYIGGVDVEGVWRTAEHAIRRGVHVEIVCLLVTGVSDDEETIEWIVRTHLLRLGEDVPIHFTRYFPAWRFKAPPTPIENLEMAYKKAKEAGIRYVYVGNVPGMMEDTYCPSCGTLLIRRRGFSVSDVRLTPDNLCPCCGERIPIKGTISRALSPGSPSARRPWFRPRGRPPQP
jgi:pyruvate formate lyase activating enzyme